MSLGGIDWPEDIARFLALGGVFVAAAAGGKAPLLAGITGLALGRYWYKSRNDLKGPIVVATLGVGAGMLIGAIPAANLFLTAGLLSLGVAGGWYVHARGVAVA